MKCNDLKVKLDRKDDEVKSRTENTVKCFELIKDFIIDKLIEDHIECEFNGSGSYIEPKDVYDELFKKIGLDVSELMWDYRGFFLNSLLEHVSYITRTHTRVHRSIGDNFEERLCKEIKQYEDLRKFKESFDGKLFKKLIIDHVLSLGFKYKYIKNIYGQTVKTESFLISSSALENKCCSEQVKPFDGDGELNDNLIGCVVIVLLCVIAFIYFVLAR